MLIARLGVAKALGTNAPAEEAIAVLSARGVAVSRDAKSAKVVTSDGPQKTWRYEVDLPRTATWLLTVGNAQPVFAGVDKRESRLLSAGGADGASDAGLVPLSAGRHQVSVTSTGGNAPDIYLVAGCHPVLPAGGWQSSAKLTYGNLGRTLVQALRQTSRLPAQEGLAPVPVADAKVSLNVPSEGVYTVLLGGASLERASYRLAGCEETAPGPMAADGWREGSTVVLAPGTLSLELAGLDAKKNDGRVRLVRRSSADAEYLAVLQSMGVKLESAGKTTGALEAPRTGLARRAAGDSTAGLAALAGKPVTREEAERILGTPVIAKMLARGGAFPRREHGDDDDDDEDDDDDGTFEEPVTGTLQQGQEADPQ